MSAGIAKEADKPTPAQLVAEASVVVRLAATQWRPAYALARTIATIGDLQSAVTDLAAENARLKAALDGLLSRYVTLVESGDAGNWDAEKEPQVIAARAAIAKAKGAQS